MHSQYICLPLPPWAGATGSFRYARVDNKPGLLFANRVASSLQGEVHQRSLHSHSVSGFVRHLCSCVFGSAPCGKICLVERHTVRCSRRPGFTGRAACVFVTAPRRAHGVRFFFQFLARGDKEERGEKKLDKERVHYIETTKRMEEKGVERETNGCQGCICTDTSETRRDRRELRERNEWMWRLQMYKLVWAQRQRNEWKRRELRERNEGCRCTNSHGRGDNKTNGREGN